MRGSLGGEHVRENRELKAGVLGAESEDRRTGGRS